MFPRDPDDLTPGPTTGRTALLPLAEGPCPTCAAFIDQLDGAAKHVSDRVHLAVVAKTPLPGLLAFADERGWRRLRFLSSATNTYPGTSISDGSLPAPLSAAQRAEHWTGEKISGWVRRRR